MTRITRRFAAVAFADVAGWAHLVEENELDAVQAWNALRTGLIEPKIQEHSGRLVDLAGDAVFVEFPSAVAALNWALALQRRRLAQEAKHAAAADSNCESASTSATCSSTSEGWPAMR